MGILAFQGRLGIGQYQSLFSPGRCGYDRMITRIGKSRIELRAEGCIKCGTLWSHRWEKIREVSVQIGSWHGAIDLNVCGDCLEKQKDGQLDLKFNG